VIIKVFLTDDHEIVRSGLKLLLEEEHDIVVVGEAGSGEEMLEKLQSQDTDVVLLDMYMPGMGGLEATSRLIQLDRDLKIIVLTVQHADPYPTRFLNAGAMGYVTKCCGVSTIISAVRTVAGGRTYICEQVAQQIAISKSTSRRNLKTPFDELSARELQIALMLCQGLTLQDISDNLYLSPKTVSTYRHRVYQKLGVESDVQLIHLALRYGIVEC